MFWPEYDSLLPRAPKRLVLYVIRGPPPAAMRDSVVVSSPTAQIRGPKSGAVPCFSCRPISGDPLSLRFLHPPHSTSLGTWTSLTLPEHTDQPSIIFWRLLVTPSPPLPRHLSPRRARAVRCCLVCQRRPPTILPTGHSCHSSSVPSSSPPSLTSRSPVDAVFIGPNPLRAPFTKTKQPVPFTHHGYPPNAHSSRAP